MKIKWLIAAFLCALSLPARADYQAVDGDSLVVNGVKIRLVGIDSPEYDQWCKKASGKKYKCGEKASNYMKKMIANGKKQRQKIKCENHGTDRYNRTLSVCYLDKLNLNAEMVKAGWAVTYRHDMYKAAESEAKKAKKGVWQGKFMRPELHRMLKRLTKS